MSCACEFFFELRCIESFILKTDSSREQYCMEAATLKLEVR